MLDENALLRRQIRELQEQLEKERSAKKELDALREYAFDTKTEYSPKVETQFSELQKDKKIVVIGGHVNWRNSLKKKYPAIQVFDGHIETADLKPIENADFVFLNVSNMSHGMYYKVIPLLREKEIPFGYLGRSVNQELYEKEMAEIMVRSNWKN